MNCLNCEQEIKVEDKFCSTCGQENISSKSPFKDIVIHWLNANFNFDTKLWITLKYLLLFPGKIAYEYNEGKRNKFVHPIKLYLFITIIVGYINYNLNTNERNYYADIPIEEIDTLKSLTYSLGNINIKNKPTEYFKKIAIANKKTVDSLLILELGNLNNISPLEKYIFIKFSKIITYNKSDLEAILKKNFSISLFLLMPLFAVMLMVLFKKSKKYYVEHLVFSLYLHSFLYFLVFISQVFGIYSSFIEALLLIFIPPYYLYVSLKYFYKQSFLKTFFKTATSIFLHGILLIITVSVAILLMIAKL